MRIVRAFMLLSGIVLTLSGARAQSCQQICNQAYAFGRQSRGDLAFIQQMQQLSNACQSCQLSERVRPRASNPPPSTPTWTPPVETEQEKAVSRSMQEVLERTGDWAMRGKILPQGAPLSSGTVQMETVKIPDGYVDPFAQRAPSVTSSAPYSPSADNCGVNMRMVVRNGVSICEMYMAEPPK